MDFTVICKFIHGKIVAEIDAPEANKYTKYAYYLYDNKNNIQIKQGYINQNKFEFEPEVTGIYYVKGFVKYKNSLEKEYNKKSKSSDKITYYKTKRILFEELDKEDFKPKEPIIYDILWNDIHFEILVNYKSESDKAVIWGTGDTVKNGSYPIFSRATWINNINYTNIYYFDPTIYINDEITLGWGYGTNDNWYLEKIAYLINYILNKQNIDKKNILFYGSSGGGFMSIMLATLFRGKCAVINPQLIVENFWPRYIELLTNASLKENEKFLTERTHVVELMKRENYVPQIHLSQNVQAERDIKKQLNPFLEELSLSRLNCTDRIKIELYYDEKGHSGMPSKEKCLQTIEKQLNSELQNKENIIPNNSFLGKVISSNFLPQNQIIIKNERQTHRKNFEDLCNKNEIPLPNLYFPDSETIRYADSFINGTLFVLPRLESMPYTLEKLDWNIKYSTQHTTFSLYLQCLTPVPVLIKAYIKTKNIKYIEFARKFVGCWDKYKKNANINKYCWCDHSVSLRLATFIYLGKIALENDLWEDNFYKYLLDLIDEHGKWLYSDETYYKNHNHGIMQDRGLIYAGVFLQEKEWINHGINRLIKQAEWAFNSEGVHKENSSGYALMVKNMFSDIADFLLKSGYDEANIILNKLKNVDEYIHWLTLPNGKFIQIGDTSYGNGKLDKTNRINYKFYPDAGMYFYRSNSEEKYENNTWKFIKSGYKTTTHKHCDDCSFALYSKGYEIFVDCGVYGYAINEHRKYFLSPKAHNTVVVDDSSYKLNMDMIDNNGMESYEHLEMYDHVKMFNNSYDGVKFTRDFYSADDLTVLVDTLQSNKKHTYSQIFHLSEQMSIISSSDNEVVIKLANTGYIVRLKQLGTPVKISVIKGDVNKADYGIISRGTNHLDVITTLKFDITADNTQFITSIAIENQDGMVRIGDELKKSDIISLDLKKKSLLLDDFIIDLSYIMFDKSKNIHSCTDNLNFTPRTTNMKQLKIAAIMDEFTLGCYAPECNLLELTPQNWKEEVDTFQPDLLFIEAIYQGKKAIWFSKTDKYCEELQRLTSYIHEKHIPVVFWNKEDPVHTNGFMTTARYADFVFTTDIDCIAQYKKELGHDRVYHLHFAAQPAIHNPIEKYERKDKFCFAGAYYHRYTQRCKVFDEFSELFINSKGLDIYDRNYQNARPEHAFPEQYEKYILGSLPANQIDVAYKGYYYGINMNSIHQSQTMFARRAFEMLASNTIVIGNFSRGIKNYFGDLTISTDDAKTFFQYMEKYCKNDIDRDKYRLAGLRKVLSEHLYQNRLGYITQKVFGIDMKPCMQEVTVLAYAQNVNDAIRLEKMFHNQTYKNAKIIFIGTATTEQKSKYLCIEQTSFANTKLESICNNGLVAWWDSKDWYGKNYLTDIVLSWNYGNFRAVGKASYFSGKNKELQNAQNTYHFVDALSLRTSVFKVSEFYDITLDQLSGDMILKGENLFSIDKFNYCQNWSQDNCLIAEDLNIVDCGLNLSKIITCAENIKISKEQNNIFEIDGKTFAKYKPSDEIPIKYEVNENYLEIYSNLPQNSRRFIYHTEMEIDFKPWLSDDGMLHIQFIGNGELDITPIVICYNEYGEKISQLYPKLNCRAILQFPHETSKIVFVFRIKGEGNFTLKKVIIDNKTDIDDNSCFLSKSDVLILVNKYPSYSELYSRMFVHKRMMVYKDSGYVYDVMQMSLNKKYREFEGINIFEDNSEKLVSILKNGAIKTVCVHLLNKQMWEILKHYIGNIRLLIWIHGAEIQPWWRRKFNFKTDSELEKAKQLSDVRMQLWQEIFATAQKTDNIHFVFVSQYFADEVISDYKIELKPDQYSIIHNLIDTQQFEYHKKDAEQRKKILTIKSFNSKNYANDLTAKGIIELSKRECFKELEIDIYGQGKLFDEINNLLEEFDNVNLYNTFLTQSEIANIHKSHGIYIATTRSDTHGVSRYEAMSSGLVPIAHNCSAIPEFVDSDCGILIPAESYIELADAIEKLYNEPELFCRLSENAAKRVRSQTSKEFTIDKEIALIYDVKNELSN